MIKNYFLRLRLDTQINRINQLLIKPVVCLLLMMISVNATSQCSTTFTPATSCASGDQIQTFTLNNIAAAGNGGCSTNAYGLFATPVWNLLIGSTYSWTITNGPTWSQGVAIWIDLNNDGFLTSNEQLGNDPSGLVHTGTFTIPFGATGANNVRMRLRCQYATTLPNTNTTACDAWTFGETEDYLVNLIPPTPCSTSPGPNTIVTPTYAICPGSSTPITLLTSYTVGNITYQWASATNSVGPFVAIPNATNSVYTANTLTTTTWYQLVATCANGGAPTTISPNQVMVSPVITSNVPYYEGFEGLNVNNDLPNCSWTKGSNATCQTYISPNNQNRIPRTGNKFASFYYSPAGANYFYTNGIQMYAGVTYSASMFFTTEYYGYNTWNLGMLVGPNQSTVGLVSVANLTYAASPSYKQLNNTFTVPTSGIYYVAIKAISNGVCCGYYLSWDDLSVTIPCDLNTPNVSVATAGSSTICSGQSVNLTASGATTYTWSTGATGATISDMPNYNTTYVATGTSTLTNCMASASKNVVVNTSPVVSIVPSSTAVCEGNPVNLIAFGASSYTWNTSATGNFVTVTPLTSGPYNVIGVNSNNNCTGTASQMITVNPLPAITAQNLPATSCMGADVTLTGGGGLSYTWTSNNAYVQGSPVVVNPNSTTTYSVAGTDVNGCSNRITITQQVFTCVGIHENTASLNGLSIYPNPNNGEFNIELKNGLSKTIEVLDVTGRVILTESRSEDAVNVNINSLANGIYYVKVKSDNSFAVLKIVKQ